MCGIVFVGGVTLSSANIERFENMLFADTFRGEHSTGVMAYYKPYNEQAFIKVAKKAIPGDMFVRSQIWDDVKEHKTKNVNPVTKATTTSSINPKFMVGHNRYATAGAVNDKNAHPFQHEHITLVHNGSLVDQSLLPDHKRFEVDSENVCYSIATIGIAETIKKLHGAFVLVWHDAKENTLNFIRNDERPFYMMKTNTGDWYGASEKDMIKWIMSRRKFNPTIEKEFELEVGVQYIFDTADGLKFREEVKHELPTFRSTYSYNYRNWNTGGYNSYDDDYDDYDWRANRNAHGANSYPNRVSSNTHQTSEMRATLEKHHQLNEMLRGHGVDAVIGDRIKFEAFQFEPYPKNPERGQLTGWIGEGEYIEVQGHGVDKNIYGGEQLYSGKVISAYEANYILTLIVSDVRDETVNVTPIPLDDDFDEDDEMEHIIVSTVRGTSLIAQSHTPDDTDVPLDPEMEEEESDGNEMDVTRDGSVYTKKEWERHDCLNSCGNCGSPIPFDFMADATIFRDFAYCDACVDAGLIDGIEPKESQSKGEPQLGELRFECIECSTELPVDAESEKECVCLQCFANKYANKPKGNVRPILTYRKTLQNGMKVTLSQWNEMNTCSWCHDKIPFKKAATTEFVGSTPCCETCAKKLELGMVPSHNK
ncbi:hypothetical protein [Salmonella phage SE131]|uniref:Glutamine amidotransferase type-2 domain-containing protein n=1 Tax=Salmonella phage SE131 TaxID=2081631 RepID=A0A2P1CAG6_9CAUD|nr:glutamine amidotransferase [Salmonella phage SE131]AVJ48181.1 hypothetical protein [Salmonella phage SE131]